MLNLKNTAIPGPLALVILTGLSGCVSVPLQDQAGEAARASVPETPIDWASIQNTVGDVQVGWVSALNDNLLEELVAEALLNNRNLQAAAANVDKSTALAVQAGAALTPGVGLNLGSANSGLVEGSSSSELSVGAQLSWELDLWGRVRSGQQAAVNSLEAAKADYRYTQHSIAAGVARAYFMSIEAQLQEAIASGVVDTLTETNRIVQLQYDNGLASGQDTALVRSDLASAKEQLVAAQGGKRDAVRALELLLGRYPGAELEVRQSLPATPAPPPAGVPSEILERRPDLVAAERRIAAAIGSTEAAKAARLPQISLTANVGGGASSSLSDILNPANLAWTAASNLLTPVLDGGAGKARVQASEADQEAAVAAYAQAALTAFGEVESSLDLGTVLRDRREQLQIANQEANEALRLANLRFKAGESDLLDVLTIQQRVFGSESTLASVQRNQLTQFVDLNIALGGQW